MRQNQTLLLATIVIELAGLAAFAAEPGTSHSQATSPQTEAAIGSAPSNPSLRIVAFLADTDGKQTHDFPAWNDYRQVVGDSPASRAVFADMLKAESGLCAVIGGDPKHLAEALAQRVNALHALLHQRERTTKDGLT
ncbi:MAG: hypothetical protein WCB27_14345 [Thermoguttaceae bacterium]